jgi:hypothetical protein
MLSVAGKYNFIFLFYISKMIVLIYMNLVDIFTCISTTYVFLTLIHLAVVAVVSIARTLRKQDR